MSSCCSEANKSLLIEITHQIIFNKGSQYNTLITDCALRIHSFLSSEFLTGLPDNRKELVRYIISSCLRSEKCLGQLITVVSLSHLLISGDTAEYFLNFDGMDILFTILKSTNPDITICYYSLLCIWNLSYHSRAFKFVINSKNKFFDVLMNVCSRNCFEKIGRIFVKIIQNCLKDSNAKKIVLQRSDVWEYLEFFEKRGSNDGDFLRILQTLRNLYKQLVKSDSPPL